MSLTTDRNNPCLNEEKDNGQNECYLILSDEERAKGFIRPVRRTYLHRGRLYDKGVEILKQPDTFNEKTYVAIATVIQNEDGSRKGGKYLTQEELDQYNKTGGYVGGCGHTTTMAQEIAETYARDPKFYGATFCTGCGKHLPVGEFVWEGTDIRVGD